MIVEQYWAGIARRLQIDSGMLNSLVPHNVTKGSQNELTLARMIEHLAPPGIGVGSGILFDHRGTTSSQMDVVLFDTASQPQLLAQTNQVMFPVETVRMVIEVKTALSGEDIFKDFPKKKRTLEELQPVEGFVIPPFGLFAYEFADSDYGRAEDLSGLSAADRPDLGCVVTPGFSITPDSCGFVPLLSDEQGGAAPFVQPTDPSSSTAHIGGTNYPVYMLGRYRGEKHVGDPGRSLLLFCMSLMSKLDYSGSYRWVQAYANSTINTVQTVPAGATG